jgi:hypothetical protein
VISRPNCTCSAIAERAVDRREPDDTGCRVLLWTLTPSRADAAPTAR